MTVQAAVDTESIPQLLTVTWAGDLEHFRLLRESLQRSALADCPHQVIVQTEDLALFEAFRCPGLTLRTSAELLPAAVEQHRRQARLRQIRWGRRGTTVAGSLARRFGWPEWPRYTGWHTQQLCKLSAASDSEADTVVVLDSDVVVTRYADPADFRPRGPGRICCHQDWRAATSVSRKVAHWQRSAHRLLQLPAPVGEQRDVYYDTPFIFDPDELRTLLQWLQQRYRQPWWRTLLACPPRQWSEFGLYRAWLRNCSVKPVDWLDRARIAYLYDASDAARLGRELRELIDGQGCHYVTIHSQSSGRGHWGPEDYASEVRAVLSGR